jgi:hypothetical protein
MRLRLTICGLLLALAAPAAALDVISASEVREGARGVCVTEMDGGELVEIPLEVLGTLGPSTPEGELVLVRLEGERFEQTGIIAGMSGSPVYVDGRLLGALAYGWAFSEEPIGGVTPFERMQRLGDLVGSVGSGGAAARRPELVDILEAVRARSLGTMLTDWLVSPREPAQGLRPLALPVSGVAPRVDWLADAWSRLGWMSAPVGGPDGAEGGELVPGAMVAGVLARGDVTLAAGGTVTAVDGDRVWAFGHPFLGAGDVRLPMARARVIGVLPSQLNSFKFFSVGAGLGAFETDRAHGIWGRIGPAPSMVPVDVEVDGRSYRFESVRHPTLTALLVGYLTASSHAVRGRTFGDQTVTLDVQAEFDDGRSASLQETFAGADAPALAAGMSTALVAYLDASAFDRPDLARVSVDLRSTETLRNAEVVEIVPDRRRVQPGDEVVARVRVRPHRKPEAWHTVRVRVPETASAGRLDLVVADGASWSAYDLRMRPQRPKAFEDELDLVARLEPSTRLVAALERPDPALVTGSGAVSAPVGVLLELAGGLGDATPMASWGVVARSHRDLDYPLAGAARIRLEVRPEGRNPAPLEDR